MFARSAHCTKLGHNSRKVYILMRLVFKLQRLRKCLKWQRTIFIGCLLDWHRCVTPLMDRNFLPNFKVTHCVALMQSVKSVCPEHFTSSWLSAIVWHLQPAPRIYFGGGQLCYIKRTPAYYSFRAWFCYLYAQKALFLFVFVYPLLPYPLNHIRNQKR